MNLLKDGEMPIGLSMALAENLEAMKRFSNLSAQRRTDVVRRARDVESREEMQNLVNSLME
ncbi:MAG: hypothetical protein Q4D04_11270 [Clostridia bacterium]|nr:hypothetical protein [Clostridia bacterium]